jgi:EmrB/QacA subfamily drug resistance transporter
MTAGTEFRVSSRAAARGGALSTLIAVAAASVTLPMTVTGPAVALTDLTVDLRASVAAGQWVQNAYGVTFAAFLLAAGALGDRFGRRRVLAAGIMLFSACSGICAAASSVLVIDIARAVQGIGAAGILTSGAAIFAAAFTGPARARAFGVLGASFGCGLALGPIVAGALLTVLNWRAVFGVNVVIGLIALALVPRVPESSDPGATRVDWSGLALFSASLAGLAFTFVAGPQQGWLSTAVLWPLLGAVAALAAFVLVENRSAEPMFDLSLFRRPSFVAVVCQPFTITFGFVVLLVYLPPYLQGVGGQSATSAGALLLPLTVPVLALPLVAGRLAARVPLRVMLASSSLLIAAGSLWLVTLDPGDTWRSLAGPLIVFGIGVGSAFGVMDNAAVSVVPVERSGVASGMFNTMRITGESIAIAAGGAVLSSLTLSDLTGRAAGLGEHARAAAGAATQGRLAGALDQVPSAQRPATLDAIAQSLTSAMHIAVLVLSALALIGALVTYLAIGDADPPGANH